MIAHRLRQLDPRWKKAAKSISILTVAMFPFQNCGQGFSVDEGQLSSLQGNSNQGSHSDDDGLDKTPPSIAILSPTANSLTRGSFTISGSCEGGLDVVLTINGGSAQTIKCAAGDFSQAITLSQNDGSIVLAVSQVDIAGNTGRHQVTISKDSVAPVVAISAPAQNATLTSQSLTTSGSCESGLPVTISGSLLSAAAQANCVGGSFSASVSTVSSNGNYQLIAAQTDAAGNSGSVSRNVTLNLPAGAPSIRISAPAANSATRTGVTLTGSCTNGLSVRVSGTGVNAASNVNCNSGSFSTAISFSSGDGTKNIIVAQTNASGITGQDSRSFTLDTTAPSISILSPAANTQAETALTISGSCETGLTVSISGTGVAAASTTTCNSSMFQSSVTLSSGTGTKAITVSQTDAVGNIGSNSRSFEKIAPSLDGALLYANNCASCHGALASSTKTNRSANQISSAISSISQMRGIRLSSEQIAAISSALQKNLVNPVACTDSSKLLGPQVKRLTAGQYANSLRNAFGNIFQQSQFPNLNDANPRIGLAADPDHLNIDEVNVDALYDSAQSLVATVLSSNSTVSSCVAGSGTDCYNTIATNFGLKLWRRPLTSTELTSLQTRMNAVSTAGANRGQRMEFLLKYLILAPEHMFRSEIGASSSPATSIFSLTPYEVASLLSFTVWDYPPDDNLLEAARTGSLSTKAQLKAQLTRMMQSPLFTKKMATFAIDILKIEGIKTVVKDTSFGMTAADRLALFESARITLEDLYNNPDANFMAPFTNSRFHSNNLTARYFNISANGLNSNFTAFNASSSERYGMLSHPAFLTTISGQVSSGIVRRGVYALEQLLCQHLGNPPANTSGVTDLPEGWDASKVTSVEELKVTHSSQAACIGCHQKIDPAGAGFENFSPFGQFRLFEKNRISIDASGSLSGVSLNPITFSNSVGYFQALAQSGTMRQCLEKRFFKYAAGESHETTGGQCEFSNFEYQISRKNESIQSVLESFVELESFSRRNPASAP